MFILVNSNSQIIAYSDNTQINCEDNSVKRYEITHCDFSFGNENYYYTEEKGVYLNPEYIQNSINKLKFTKIQSLSTTCSNIIYQGTDVTLSDNTTQHFTLTERDQLNLSGIGLKLLMGAEQVAWHEDDETKECQYYSAQDAQLIIGTLTTFKEYHITYFRDLRIYVNSLQTVEEVNAIEYGFALPEEFKSQVLKDLEQMLGM